MFIFINKAAPFSNQKGVIDEDIGYRIEDIL